MLISGHETRSMLERYNIVSLKNLQDAGAKLDAWSRQQEKLIVVPNAAGYQLDELADKPQSVRPKGAKSVTKTGVARRNAV